MVVEAQKSDKRRCGAWSVARHLAENSRVQPVFSCGVAEVVRLPKDRILTRFAHSKPSPDAARASAEELR